MATESYGTLLTVSFGEYVARYEAATGKTLTSRPVEALAANYALEAAKDVTARIMENSLKLNPKTTRPTEFLIAKRRIDTAWASMHCSLATVSFHKFKENLINLLKDLSTPTEAELVSAEVIGDQKMIIRTTSDYKEILRFLETRI